MLLPFGLFSMCLHGYKIINEFKFISVFYYARKQLLLSARFSHRNSVCLSVCPSHGWISQKRCKMGSPNFHRWLPGKLKF